MMERYQIETSQIHAPASLVERTKRAVQEEEKRIQRENEADGNVMRETKEQIRCRTNKWVLPVAAAAVFLVLVNVLAIMPGRRTDMSGSGQADSAMAGEATIEEEAEDAHMTAGETGIMEDLTAEDSGMPNAELTGIDGNMPDGEGSLVREEEDKVKGTGDFSDEDTTGSTEDFSADRVTDAGSTEQTAESEQENSLEEKSRSEDVEATKGETILSVTEVEEIPDFYGSADTQCVILQGLRFYVSREQDGIWVAYVYMDRKKYVITGESGQYTEERAFVEDAYELLLNGQK